MAGGEHSAYSVRVDDVPVHEMSDVADDAVREAGGNARDGGRWVELISANRLGAERLMMGVYWLNPGERHLLHHHDEAAEFYFVVSGSGVFTVGDEQIRAESGTAIYIPPRVTHAVDNDGDEDLAIVFRLRPRRALGDRDGVGRVRDGSTPVSVDVHTFRTLLARYPSGVTVITVTGADGAPTDDTQRWTKGDACQQ